MPFSFLGGTYGASPPIVTIFQRTYVHQPTHVRSSANARTFISQCTYVHRPTHVRPSANARTCILPSSYQKKGSQTPLALVSDSLHYSAIALLSLCSWLFKRPVFLSLADVSLVAALSGSLTSVIEFLSLCRSSLLQ